MHTSRDKYIDKGSFYKATELAPQEEFYLQSSSTITLLLTGLLLLICEDHTSGERKISASVTRQPPKAPETACLGRPQGHFSKTLHRQFGRPCTLLTRTSSQPSPLHPSPHELAQRGWRQRWDRWGSEWPLTWLRAAVLAGTLPREKGRALRSASVLGPLLVV